MTSVSPAIDWVARRRAPSLGSLPTVAVVLGSVAGLGASHGGYFPSSWGWSALLFSASGALALLVRRGIAVSRGEVVYLGALTALLGWTAASLLWTSTATQTMYEIERTLSYVTFAAALVLIARRLDVQVVLASVLVAVTALGTYGLLTRILPGRLTTFDSIAVYRLDSPARLLERRGSDQRLRDDPRRRLRRESSNGAVGRALAATSLVVLLPTLYFTFGRGGWLALFAGLVAAIALDPRRLQLTATMLVVAPWPVLALWRAYESRGLTTDYSPLATAATDGRQFAWTLVGLSGASFRVDAPVRVALCPRHRPAGCTQPSSPAPSPWPSLSPSAPRSSRTGAVPHRDASLDSIRQSSPERARRPDEAALQPVHERSPDSCGRARWTTPTRVSSHGSGAGSFEEWWLRHRPLPARPGTPTASSSSSWPSSGGRACSCSSSRWEHPSSLPGGCRAHPLRPDRLRRFRCLPRPRRGGLGLGDAGRDLVRARVRRPVFAERQARRQPPA